MLGGFVVTLRNILVTISNERFSSLLPCHILVSIYVKHLGPPASQLMPNQPFILGGAQVTFLSLSDLLGSLDPEASTRGGGMSLKGTAGRLRKVTCVPPRMNGWFGISCEAGGPSSAGSISKAVWQDRNFRVPWIS